MGGGWGFGRTSDVEINCCVLLSILYLSLPIQKMRGWQMYAIYQMNGDVGLLACLGYWEVDIVEQFLLRLQGKRVYREEEDKVISIESKSSKFSIKALYFVLELGNLVSFSMDVIWNSCVLLKVGFFDWEAMWGNVLTLDQLQRRGWSLANKCFLCNNKKESINHIPIHCMKTRVFMAVVVFPFLCVMGPFFIGWETLFGWHGSLVGKKHKNVWRTTPFIFWIVWKERNRRLFENRELFNQRLKYSCL